MIALRQSAMVLFLVLYAAAVVALFVGLVSFGQTPAARELMPGGKIYVLRSEAVLYACAVIPLACAAALALGRAHARLRGAVALAVGGAICATIAFAWRRGLPISDAWLASTGYRELLALRATLAVVSLAPFLFVGMVGAFHMGNWPELERPAPRGPRVLMGGVVLTALAVSIAYVNDFNQFRRMAQEASDDIDEYFYDQAEKTVRQLRALGADDVRVAGLGLLAVLDNINIGKTSVERMLLMPDGIRELARRYPQANADFMLGKYDEGRARLEAAIAADPNDAKALYDLARVTARRGDPLAAVPLFTRASDAARERYRQQPSPDREALLVRVLTADANARTGAYDLSRALVLYQEALMLHESPELHLQMAHVHRLLGRGKEGVEHVRRAVELKPELTNHQATLLDALLERSPDCAPALYSVRARE